MKKKILLIIVSIILVAGCIGIYNSNKKGLFVFNVDENKKIINIENENKELSLKELSSLIFKVNQDTKKVSDMTDLELIHAAIGISVRHVDTITGVEIKEIVKKYFNIDNVNLVDITCNLKMSDDHDNRMYIYNPKTDKYENNPEHLGHGGKSNGIGYYIMNGKETIEGEFYIYSGEIFYYYNGCVWDTCGSTGIFDIYLSYEDANNKSNKQFSAYEKDDICVNSTCDTNKIYELIKDNIKTISFYYKKNNDIYVFDHYEVK